MDSDRSSLDDRHLFSMALDEKHVKKMEAELAELENHPLWE
jgi:hypothetical protein